MSKQYQHLFARFCIQRSKSEQYQRNKGRALMILYFFYLKIIEKILYSFIMTEENFFDMFNRVHNPDYFYAKKKIKKKIEKKNQKQKNDSPKFKIFRV